MYYLGCCSFFDSICPSVHFFLLLSSLCSTVSIHLCIIVFLSLPSSYLSPSIVNVSLLPSSSLPDLHREEEYEEEEEAEEDEPPITESDSDEKEGADKGSSQTRPRY